MFTNGSTPSNHNKRDFGGIRIIYKDIVKRKDGGSIDEVARRTSEDISGWYQVKPMRGRHIENGCCVVTKQFCHM